MALLKGKIQSREIQRGREQMSSCLGRGGGWGAEGDGKGSRVSLRGDDDVLKGTVAGVAQICDYTKNH